MANAPETLRRVHSYTAHLRRQQRQLSILDENLAVLRKWASPFLKKAEAERELLVEKISKTQAILEVLQDSMERE